MYTLKDQEVLARTLFRVLHPESKDEEVERNMTNFPLSPYYRFAAFILQNYVPREPT
jgi:hypothetical protein